MERDGGLSNEDKAAITDQKRVWEVRKYCQTRASLARHGHESSRTSEDGASLNNEQEGTDAALTALLRGVLTQLDADIVGICMKLITGCALMFAGHDIAPRRTYTIFLVWGHTG